MAGEATDTPLGSTAPTNETPSSTGGVTDPNATISPIKNDVGGIKGFESGVDNSDSFYNALIQANYDNSKSQGLKRFEKKGVENGYANYNMYDNSGGELVDILLSYPWTI